MARSVFWPMSTNRTTSFVSSSERLDAEHGADAELRMADLHARPQRQAGGLILVLVGVRLAFLLDGHRPAGRGRTGWS